MKTKEEIKQLAETEYGTEIGSIRGSNPYDLEADRKNGFIKGYNQCQEDMAVKIKEAYKEGLLEGYACMPSIEGMPLINSLNKQD